MNAEAARLAAITRGAPWRKWGPYLADREWGTVREDYSADGAAWTYVPHDHARSRAYRWGEDGLLGISDDRGRLCFALALWNRADPILKERLFGLTGPEGNHGEDVKELYHYLDSTPTHSYMRALYRYPQAEFPYAWLRDENSRRTREQPEFELADTGVFDGDRYFDVVVEYAKAAPEDVLIRVSATNRSDAPAPLHLLPTLWYRNTWSWGGGDPKPTIERAGDALVHTRHDEIGSHWLAADGRFAILFTENESNAERLWGAPNGSPFVKDAFHAGVIGRDTAAISGERGTKCAFHALRVVPAGETWTMRLRLVLDRRGDAFHDFDKIFAKRRSEADEFYAELGKRVASDDARLVQRQALSGLLWSKQYYHYDVEVWLDGDPAQPPPPPARRTGRNADWRHLNNHYVMSMPDTWEYPWWAAWDLAFHAVAYTEIDPAFAKDQLVRLLREWYQHPNGQLPAYEWNFSDVNPPVHAWAAWRVYKIDEHRNGKPDRLFLERVFHKLLLNFTWWVNREDSEGHNVFQGGFLGLDNIGVFDRSATLPGGGHLEQSDGTAWMGMFCLELLRIALELAREDRAYEDIASKFFEHFLYIAAALNDLGGSGIGLWDEGDEFFYDAIHLPGGAVQPLRVRSLVGLIPLLAVQTVEPSVLERVPEFRSRLEWFLEHRPELASLVSRWMQPGMHQRHLLALVRGHRMKRLLRRMLDPAEFLSDFGVRSLSRYHRDHPFVWGMGGEQRVVRYDPAESTSGVFGGNSNWRGPIWFPINYLLIESLEKFHHYYGPEFRVECPTGSGQLMSLQQVADEIARRLTRIFLVDEQGRRPVFGSDQRAQGRWRDDLLFYEYFDGDTGRGLGASHQTGWTALVANLLARG